LAANIIDVNDISKVRKNVPGEITSMGRYASKELEVVFKKIVLTPYSTI
jgi:hypothetical protein